MAHGLAIYMDVQFSSRGVPVQFVESSKKERERKERKEGKKREGNPEGMKKRKCGRKKKRRKEKGNKEMRRETGTNITQGAEPDDKGPETTLREVGFLLL